MLETLPVATRFRLQQLLDAQSPPMSQSELARQSGVSLVTVNAIARNRTTQVSLATLGALAGVLRCAPGDIIEKEEKIAAFRLPPSPRSPGKKRR